MCNAGASGERVNVLASIRSSGGGTAVARSRIMSIDHKQTSQHFLELWGDNVPHHPVDFLAEGYVNHQLPNARSDAPANITTAEWQALLDEFHKGFSDVKIEILQQIEEGDLVATRFQMSATNSGGFAGLAATNKSATWTGVETDRYEGDQLAESWVNWDKTAMLDALRPD